MGVVLQLPSDFLLLRLGTAAPHGSTPSLTRSSGAGDPLSGPAGKVGIFVASRLPRDCGRPARHSDPVHSAGFRHVSTPGRFGHRHRGGTQWTGAVSRVESHSSRMHTCRVSRYRARDTGQRSSRGHGLRRRTDELQRWATNLSRSPKEGNTL
jgi:hypothetical protein